jgi:hypothetical protein
MRLHPHGAPSLGGKHGSCRVELRGFSKGYGDWLDDEAEDATTFRDDGGDSASPRFVPPSMHPPYNALAPSAIPSAMQGMETRFPCLKHVRWIPFNSLIPLFD